MLIASSSIAKDFLVCLRKSSKPDRTKLQLLPSDPKAPSFGLRSMSGVDGEVVGGYLLRKRGNSVLYGHQHRSANNGAAGNIQVTSLRHCSSFCGCHQARSSPYTSPSLQEGQAEGVKPQPELISRFHSPAEEEQPYAGHTLRDSEGVSRLLMLGMLEIIAAFFSVFKSHAADLSPCTGHTRTCSIGPSFFFLPQPIDKHVGEA